MCVRMLVMYGCCVMYEHDACFCVLYVRMCVCVYIRYVTTYGMYLGYVCFAHMSVMS